jgi:hypothetical protein
VKEHKYNYSFQIKRNTTGNSLREENELTFRADIMEPSPFHVLPVED